MSGTQVLIAGAGPTGLVLALRLAHHGVPFRIVSQDSGPGHASRAMVVQARTLEFYGQLGLAEAVVAAGIRVERAHFIEDGREVATLSLKDVGAGISPYPFALSFPQDDHERLLVERLAALGVAVEWDTRLGDFEERDGHVRAVLRRGGAEEVCEAAYLCGCDGAHSAVRQGLALGFPGGTYDQLFYVADVAIASPAAPELFLHLGEGGLVLLLPVRSSGRWRLIGIVPAELDERADLTFEDVRPSAEALLGIRVEAAHWFSIYRVHHRVAARFRVGRVFLAGDAGHLHSPAGGQGMNTGIGDAVNLSWKLANAIGGRTGPGILDTYEPERIAFARTLVETTDRVFHGMVGRGWGSRVLREWVVPHLLPALSGLAAVRRAMFSAVSQTRISYRASALSEGRAGEVRGGDRLPWTGDNYASLTALDWRLHVYGDAAPALREAAAALGIPVDSFAWNEAAERGGLARDAAYLLRPDGHVAFASPDGDAAELRAFAARIGLAAPRG
jgi:2-polyprenyl-6-methoxyphenol hydroxylase-like FAD-dependent oxidoreductase